MLFYNLEYYLEFPLQILALWQGGMSFHGGLLGVVVATLLFAWRKGISPFAMGDILACVAPIGLFLGRLANFANGELFGRVSHAVPWVMVFPHGGEEPRHPSQLYEAFAEGILLFVILNALWWGVAKYRNRTGFVTAWFFILYGVFRFGLEYFREPDGHLGFILGDLSMGQLLCVPMILFGVWVLIKTSPRSKLKRLKEDL